MDSFIIILTGIISALATYILNNNFEQGAVRASALLSLMVGIFFYFFPSLFNDYLTKNIPVVFIGASFIGMVSSKVISNYFLIIISGIIFSIIYFNTSSFFTGYGGALGTSASISVLVSLSLAVVAKSKHVKKIRQIKRKNKS